MLFSLPVCFPIGQKLLAVVHHFFWILFRITQQKTVQKVSFTKHLNKFKVLYSDGSVETISRHLLDERGIYYPGHPEISDSAFAATQIDLSLPINEAVVDKDLWGENLNRNIETYIQYALSKGLKTGTYKINVRFFVNQDGSLNDFSASPDPGYKFLQFIEAIFTNGPKWKPANQNGRAVRSVYTQPITFLISRGSRLQ